MAGKTSIADSLFGHKRRNFKSEGSETKKDEKIDEGLGDSSVRSATLNMITQVDGLFDNNNKQSLKNNLI